MSTHALTQSFDEKITQMLQVFPMFDTLIAFLNSYMEFKLLDALVIKLVEHIYQLRSFQKSVKILVRLEPQRNNGCK